MNELIERFVCQIASGLVPAIPYDTFVAADLFLATGRSLEDVLPRIGLTTAEWKRLRATYEWFPTSGGEFQRLNYFTGLDDAEIYRRILPPRWMLKPDDTPTLRSTWHIREAVRRNPYIGPFADCDWPMTWIATHPVATLCSYTHDGCTVYFDGKPLAGRKGEPLAVDSKSFTVVGGRWLRDATRIYGQGQAGPKYYWYVVENAHLESFEALNLRYARDKNQAYYITGKTIRTKSPEAFEIVPELRLNYRDGTRDPLHKISVIARDREAVYYYGIRLKGAKPADFCDLGHGYATDGEKVWFLDNKLLIEGADGATFVVPGPGEPHIYGHGGTFSCVTDRYRPYVCGVACDPTQYVDDWRPFFEVRQDIRNWWWHKLVNGDH